MSKELNGKSENGQQSDLKDAKKENRRQILKVLGAAGAAAVAGGSLNVLDAHAATPNSTINLPLTIDSQKNFEVFLRAITDKKVRAGLEGQITTLPKDVADIVKMADDKHFIDLATQTYSKYVANQQGKATTADVQVLGTQLSAYITATYPAGVAVLRQYYSNINPDLRAAYAKAQVQSEASPNSPNAASAAVAANVYATANAAAIVNAVVWANVAVASLAVVALAVVVI